MDPITQGAVGAVAAKLGSDNEKYLYAAIIGALGGMAPDLDVLIRSSTDPLLALEFHRQFTHSLLFIPLLGGLCGLIAHWLLGKRWAITRRQAVLWSTLGYATHGLLDGCTSYGTQLLWPLVDKRFAWDLVSVVDPLFTLPLIFAIVLAVRRRARFWVAAAATWAVFYLGVGYVQHQRALDIGQQIAADRGHSPVRLEAKPSFANLAVWKVVYETEDRFYVDAVKPGLGESRIWEGDSLLKLDVDRAYPWLAGDTQQRRDIDRFSFFSTGYVAVDPEHPMKIIDIRYSMLPQHIDALWGIELSRSSAPHDHVTYFTERDDSSQALRKLLQMIFE